MLLYRVFEEVELANSEFVVSKKNLIILKRGLCDHYQLSLKSSPGKSYVKIDITVQEDLQHVISIFPRELAFDGENYNTPQVPILLN